MANKKFANLTGINKNINDLCESALRNCVVSGVHIDEVTLTQTPNDFQPMYIYVCRGWKGKRLERQTVTVGVLKEEAEYLYKTNHAILDFDPFPGMEAFMYWKSMRCKRVGEIVLDNI